jgi:aspartate 1-decarboxylase
MELVQLLKSKIHNVVINECQPDYIGSIEIPRPLMDAVGLEANELVHVWAISHKARIQTYVIPGPRTDGPYGVKINGGAAHHFQPGDHCVIAAFRWTDDTRHQPKILIMGDDGLEAP